MAQRDRKLEDNGQMPTASERTGLSPGISYPDKLPVTCESIMKTFSNRQGNENFIFYSFFLMKQQKDVLHQLRVERHRV